MRFRRIKIKIFQFFPIILNLELEKRKEVKKIWGEHLDIWKMGLIQDCVQILIYVVIFLLLKIMNQNSPDPYLEFRFEESLRNYQPPLRKKVKKSPQPCSQCMRRSYFFTSEQRINRIRDSWRKYQNLSKEKLQKLTIKSKAQDDSKENERKQISDFVDEVPLTVEAEPNNLWDQIELKTNNILEVKKQQPSSPSENIIGFIEVEKQIIKEENDQQPLNLIPLEELEFSLFQQEQEGEQELEEKKVCEKIEKKEDFVLKEFFKFKGGRIKVKGETRQCYLSARIWTKACKNGTDWKLKKRHPYLGESVQQISKIINESNNNSSELNN